MRGLLVGGVVGLVLALAVPLAQAVECSPLGGPRAGNERWFAALLDELALSPPDRLDFRVGGQTVFLHASTVMLEHEELLRELIENMAGELEAMAVDLGAREARPVHVMATRQEELFPGPFAFASCDVDDEPLAHYADGSVVPGTSCLVVVFPERIDRHGADTAAFVLAHEWMHTLQQGEGVGSPPTTRWWREGSAEWFAHKVVDGYDGRAHRIEQFHAMQPHCTLQQITYPVQVFFFWGEQAFDARWIMELALGGGEHLENLDAIAGIMAPEHWRAWSIALTDQTIRYPDGRPLPEAPEPERMTLRPQCPLRIQGPALSVQQRAIALSGAAGGDRISIDTGGAIVSLRWPDGRWQHIEEVRESVDPGAWDHFTVAGISADGQAADVRIGLGGLDEACACHVGEWMELEREGGRMFRDEPEGNPGLAMAGYAMDITYLHEGPILTLNSDRTYTLDDPYQQHYSARGEIFWRLSLDRRRDAGRWRVDDEHGALVLARTSSSERGSLDAAGVPSPWTSHRELPGREVPHEMHCSGDRLELSWIGREVGRRFNVAESERPPPAVFRRVAP